MVAVHDETTLRATVPTPRRAGRPAGLILVLGALTAVVPLAIDMYVPGFPAMTQGLGASEPAVQLTMTAFLAGLVSGQLLVGPLSDALGRRRPLLVAISLFAVLSVACALAPTVAVLTGTRFLQGVAGGGCMVLARAIVADRFHGPDLPRHYALMAMVLGVAPIVAPVLGGAVLSVSTWRVIFVVLAVIGVLLLFAVLLRVPETLPRDRRAGGGPGGTLRTMRRLAGRRALLGYVLTAAFSSAVLFSYIAGASFVLQDGYGASPAQFGLIFAANAAGMLAAGAAFGALSRRVRLGTLLAAHVTIAFAGTLAHVLLLAAGLGGLAVTCACLFVTLFGLGGVFPACMTLAQMLGRDASGATSALLGAVQFLLGALASPLAGLAGTSSAVPLALIMLAAATCSAAALLAVARPWQGPGETSAATP
jgi:Bcr/CflA subfamily drug resistance transporter